MTHRTPQQLALLTGIAAIIFGQSVANAQDRSFHHPLNQRTPLGHSAGWLTHIRGYPSTWLQPVKIEVPGGAEASVYAGSEQPAAVINTPAMVAVTPGHTYRIKLANMPEFPNVELYPSIEILDRLHPPAGEENRYPIPLPFTRQDIRMALAGRLVTRVIYLEDPQTAQQLDPLRREIPQAVTPTENVLQEADHLGRPMIIVRIGNRRPSPYQAGTLFYGTGGALDIRDAQTMPREITRVD